MRRYNAGSAAIGSVNERRLRRSSRFGLPKRRRRRHDPALSSSSISMSLSAADRSGDDSTV